MRPGRARTSLVGSQPPKVIFSHSFLSTARRWPPVRTIAARAFRGASFTAVAGGVAGTLAALAMFAIDAAGRTRWGVGRNEHLAASGGLVLALGATTGAILAWGAALTRAVGIDTRLGPALLAGTCVGLAGRQASFAGPLRATALAAAVPWGLALVAAVAGGIWSAARARASRASLRIGLAVTCAAAGAALFRADGHYLVGTQRGLHDAAEAASFLLLYGACSSIADPSADPPRHAARVWSLLGPPSFLAGAVTCTWHLSGAPYRAAHAIGLRHLLHEPSALGALVTRLAATATRAPRVNGAQIVRWAVGETESHDQAAAAVDLRSACRDCNIVVYFVDTLRADTAADPRAMPALARFRERSLDFVNTYSAASDTLHALPPLLFGRYDRAAAPTFLRRARDAGLDTSVFIAASARDYLAAQLPEFEFDEVHAESDRSDSEPIWGYGADTPTGAAITDRALEWMAARRGRRFLAWLYNFDLHAWRDLRDEHLEPFAASSDALANDRYRTVAGVVDRGFGRMLDGLDQLGLADNTVVVFVSDHGEALGYRNFLTHSAFLWEPLVRVPLTIRGPGVPARVVERAVTLVDVAPTLVRFLDPAIDLGGYHGVDLLRFYTHPSSPRALPILLQATAEGRPSLVGLIDAERKLVVAPSGGPAQLHDLSADDPDDVDIALREPDRATELLEELAGSPLLSD